MGYRPTVGDRIAIIEDVTTAGTSVRETVSLLEELEIDAGVVALYISVDRMERGSGNLAAIAQLKQDFGIEVYSIASVADIVDYLENTPENCVQIPDANKYAAKIREYLELYGC
jgi:orotate phosphoribosyltransferase